MIDLNNYKNKIIAHRGIHDNEKIPENSLKAFKLTIDKNIPIELDIHLTKDNELVVFHDDNLKRMTGIDKNIEQLTIEEIKKYKLLNTKEEIPTLKEVLKLVNKKVLIDIEIKGTNRIKKLIDVLLDQLNDYAGEIIIKSFNPAVIRELKKKTKKYKVGLLVSKNTNNKLYNLLSKTNLLIPLSKPDFLAISKKIIKEKNIQKYLTTYPILVWTIKTQEEIDYLNNKDFIYISNNLPFKKGK